VRHLRNALKGGDLSATLQYIADCFGDKAAFSLGFGREGMVIADQILGRGLPIRVFTIDTGRLFQETHELHQQLLARYGRRIEVYSPDHQAVEEMVSAKGPLSFYESKENRLACCHIRKVSPLTRALADAEVWLTGLRKGQSEYRQQFEMVEWHEKHQLLKVNPIIHWTAEETEGYLKQHKVPTNALYRQGFRSIGCAPCTRAVQPDEDDRAGRWWWESSHKECGLHLK
jgi:phosphoadenosine phosphosulfate reductase